MKHNILIVAILLFGAVLNLFAQDDRATFDLKGDVRQCIPSVPDNGFVLPSLRAEFSEKGTLVRLGGMDMTVENGSYTVKRDAAKRIVRLEFSAGDADRINTFSYDGQGRISEVKDWYVNIDTDEETLDSRMVRTYNAEGFPARETYYNEDGSERAVYTYSYGKTDASGNWLTRTVSEPTQGISGETETRELSVEAMTEEKASDATGKSLTSSYDDELSAALSAKKSAGKSAGGWFWTLLWGALFLSLFVHTIYVLYVKKPEFAVLPVTGDADTDEEERLADMLYSTVESNVTSLQPVGVDDAIPTTRKQMENIKDAMRRVRDASPRGARVVETYNTAVEMVADCERRVFAGSNMYRILGLVVVGVIAVLRIGDGGVLQGIAYFLFSFGAYWLGSRRQLYRVIAAGLRNPSGVTTTSSAIMAVFGFMASSRTYITQYYQNGREIPELRDEDNSEHVMFGVLGFIALVALGLFMPFVGLFNYLRFYVIGR